MTELRRLIARLLALLNKAKLDRELDDELQSHLDLASDDLAARGMSRREARRVAAVRLGGRDAARELHRDSRGLPSLEDVLRDLRYAFRTLRRDAGLATFATLTIGLGVGGAATVFSVASALLLRPLPFEAPERLVWIANGDSENLSAQTVQVNNLRDFRDGSQAFENVAGFSPFYGIGDVRLTGDGEPERLTAVPVTEGFFPLLGVTPLLGRTFTSEECLDDAPRTVMLSYRFWQRRFASDPHMVGRSIVLDDQPTTVVGVLPESFDFSAIFTPGERADLFTPFPLSAKKDRSGNTLALIGRLAPAVDLAAARAEAAVIATRMEQERPALRDRGERRNDFAPNLSPLRERVSGKFRQALLVLAAAVGFLVLIVCANLSNLLLARSSAREKEMAVRVALGAGRGRLIRQILIESLALSLAGAALGVGLAVGGTHLLANIEGAGIPLLREVRVDQGVLAFALFAAMATGVGFGLAPALRASSTAPSAALKEAGRGAMGQGRGWMRGSLVVCEVALACVLLTAVGLLLRSLIRVLDVELGFETENVLALRVDPGPRFRTPEQRTAYLDETLHRVRAIPGVEAAGLTDSLPLGDNFGWRRWDARTQGLDEPLSPLVRIVDEAYFETLRIRLLAGRPFGPADDARSPSVIIVNDALARTFWPNDDALGKVVTTSGRDYEVIGVVSEARYFGLEQESGPEFYLPIHQMHWYNSVDLVARVSRAPAQLAPQIRAALQAVDPNLPATEFRTMEQLVDRAVFPRRSLVTLLAAFAGFGLLLAALGVYGVISYSVSRRRQEMGLRMALGATALDLQLKVFSETGRLALIGIAIGAAAAWVMARALQGLLFGVSASDPTTFAGVAALLGLAAALAGYAPALRASRMNPVAALRVE